MAEVKQHGHWWIFQFEANFRSGFLLEGHSWGSFVKDLSNKIYESHWWRDAGLDKTLDWFLSQY